MIFTEIGYFSKTHGLKGELQLNITRDFDIENCNAIIIKTSGGDSPQFISEFRENKNGFIICLEEIDTIEKAKPFVGKKVAANEEFVFEDETHPLIGFTLVDKSFGVVGTITDIGDSGANPVFNIDHKGKQVILPYNEDLVIGIDVVTEVVNYEAPEGLIEMYLG
ncbi:MAG: 16S rRNA processing protein RimM [Bacteroidia bacterium]|jgi:16S rRNA processing protein RimM|nr:16S rRNA processing protein RimM [Sphingobacteriaceae bacterium]MBP9069600.1 16S rRNA processing protein RimM [Bacteroidia bacterium]